jgi:hypothetical protein
MGDTLKNWNNQKLIFRPLMHGLRNQIFTLRRRVLIQDRVINTRNYKKHICGLQSIIDKCRICRTEGETIEHIISSCTVLAQSEYKKRHDIFAKIIHMNLAVFFFFFFFLFKRKVITSAAMAISDVQNLYYIHHILLRQFISFR